MKMIVSVNKNDASLRMQLKSRSVPTAVAWDIQEVEAQAASVAVQEAAAQEAPA